MRRAERDDAGVPGGSAEQRLPDSHEDLQTALADLTGAGQQYALEHPEAAASGGWWRMTPSGRVPRSVTADPETARRAAVLVLFWMGGEGDGGPGEGSVAGAGAGPRVLLTERSAALTKHPGQISFPGGGAEEFDVDAAGTALREAQEETGLDPSRVRVLGALPPAPVPASGFIVTPVVAVTQGPGVLVPQSGEVARVLSVRAADLVEPEHRYTAVVVRKGPRLPSPAFWFGGEELDAAFIWGFTGTLLDRMLDRLGWSRPWESGRELDPRRFRR